jgi:hypothetical protein
MLTLVREQQVEDWKRAEKAEAERDALRVRAEAAEKALLGLYNAARNEQLASQQEMDAARAAIAKERA